MHRKRQVSEDSEKAVSPVIKKAKVKNQAKTGSTSTSTKSSRDAEGNPYWEIGNKRRIGTSNFKGTSLVNIREYYEAGGELKPGKKGISLTLDQYQALLKVIPALNEELRSQGHDIADTEVPASATSGEASGGAPLFSPDDDELAAKKARKKAKKKANIDATSDEEDSSS